MKTSMLQGFNGVDKTLCQTNFNMQAGFNGVQQTLINGFSNLNNQNTLNTNAIIQAGHADKDAILAYLNQSKITDLQEKLAAANGEISQRNQSQFIISQLKNNGCCTSSCCSNSCC